jgi:hypothetical protein
VGTACHLGDDDTNVRACNVADLSGCKDERATRNCIGEEGYVVASKRNDRSSHEDYIKTRGTDHEKYVIDT